MNSSRRRLHWILYCFVAALFAFAPHPATARIWMDDQGRSVDADLMRIDNGNVVLRVVATGQELPWPVSKLSQADQNFATSTYRFVKSLRSPDSDTRDNAVEKLVDIGLDAVPAFIEETNHKNGGKGRIEALVKIGKPVIPHLLRHGERICSKMHSNASFLTPNGKVKSLSAIRSLPSEKRTLEIHRKTGYRNAPVKWPSDLIS